MSAPLVTQPAASPLYAALLRMQEKNIHHLPMVEEDGSIRRLLHGRDVLHFENYGPAVLTREILSAPTPEAVVLTCRRTPALAKSLLRGGAQPRHIARLVSTACDAATERLLTLAQRELGTPPAAFAFLALGSQGRQEQTLWTDQDNAIIYEPAADEAEAGRYFCELGKRICLALDQAGYTACRGEVMASNPKWCQPLRVWKKYFEEWIHGAEPQELLRFSIFFDFRCVHGASALAAELRQHIRQILERLPSFFPRFAQNSLLFKPPPRIFGRFLGSDHPEKLDLKQVLLPLVNTARLYALREGIDATNTLARFAALTARDVFDEEIGRELEAVYEFLMRLRLRRQAEALEAGQPLDNAIDYRRLPPHEEVQLRHALARIAAVQEKVSRDFLGG